MAESERPDEEEPTPPAEEQAPEQPEQPEQAAPAEEPAAEAEAPAQPPEAPAEEAPAEEAPAEVAEEPAAAAEEAPAADEAPAAQEAPAAPPRRERPAQQSGGPEVIPGADLEPDIVPEGFDPLGRAAAEEALGEGIEIPGIEDAEEGEQPEAEATESSEERTIPQAAIDLAAGARYTATGKRKTAVARVILRPGNGAYTVNGRPLEQFFPRETLQRNIRQPLETVGYEARMDVHARLHGGGVSAQAGALRHGISRALIAADPNLRGELKRRGFLTRDARAKERKKAGLKKARKRPQFSKR
jgi:small subunit ribosomal protein S9